MSQTIQCDTCKTVVLTTGTTLDDWLHVEWGSGLSRMTLGDFCTYDCARLGLDVAAEEDAERARAMAEEDAASDA